MVITPGKKTSSNRKAKVVQTAEGPNKLTDTEENAQKKRKSRGKGGQPGLGMGGPASA